MSKLTKCNYCSLEAMKATAERRGTTVIVVHETSGEMEGWISAQYADRKEPSAYFLKLTAGCVC
jgi:hypothetical protein